MTEASALTAPTGWRRAARTAPQHAVTDLDRTTRFLVVDSRGRLVGRVDGVVHGVPHETTLGLSVRFGFLLRRRGIVPATAIELIDDATRVVGLRVARKDLDTSPLVLTPA